MRPLNRIVVCSVVWLASAGFAADNLPRIPPRSPDEALKAFEVRKGFRVELVVAEPLVQSPMACDFDEDGRVYVVELPEYNDYAKTRPHGKGRIVLLEDTKGVGVYDKRTVFADNLNYPTAVICWDGGVFVGAAPDLLYLKDTKGTGKADVRRTILSGFGTDKAGEGQLNSFRWTLENRILISTGLDGGEIANPRASIVKKEDPKAGDPKAENFKDKLSLRSMNVLFDPRSGAYELTSGGGQHGMSIDDWGRVFVSGNSEPIHTLAYDARYIAEKPNVQAPAAAINILPSGKFTKLHRISEIEPWRIMRTQLRKDGKIPGSDEGGLPSGFFTGATGVTVYRGDAFPPEYRGDIFVGEVANNLVFHARLKANGSMPLAERVAADTEFLASKDVWFRPAQFANAPDGCLYVIDMTRELIEGAAFLAPEVLKNVDPSAGVEKGRVWRIVPEGFKRTPMPKLSKATNEGLIALLDHPNGWHRDTASRLLFQRQDKAAIPSLKRMAMDAKTPQGRLHALYALASFNALDAPVLAKNLRHDEPRVREHAVRLCERRFLGADLSVPLAEELWRARADADPAVRIQLAYTLGRAPMAEQMRAKYARSIASVYVQLAIKDVNDPWMRLALSATMPPEYREQIFADLSRSQFFARMEHGPTFLVDLIGELASEAEGAHTATILDALGRTARFSPSLARALLNAVKAHSSTGTASMLNDENNSPNMTSLTSALVSDAVMTARDERKPVETRVLAIRDLTIVPYRDAAPVLKDTLKSSQPPEIQKATLELLGRFGDDLGPELILAAWPAMTPQVRATATEVWLSRNNWIPAFLDAVEEKKIARGEIDSTRAALLKKAPARNISVRAAKLFAAPPDRQKVFDDYRKTLEMKGDAVNGKAVFKKNCAACHKLDGIGEEVGADLKAIRDRGMEAVLLNIIDPNREVKPQFLSYQVELKNGRQVSGMLMNESATGFDVRRADGTTEKVRRTDVETMRSLGLSFMPDGIEKEVPIPAMADLLEYLRTIK